MMKAATIKSVVLNGVTFGVGDTIKFTTSVLSKKIITEILCDKNHKYFFYVGNIKYSAIRQDGQNYFEIVEKAEPEEKPIKNNEAGTGSYPLGSKWRKQNVVNEIWILSKTSTHDFKGGREKEYKQPNRVSLMRADSRNEKKFVAWCSVKVFDPDNITDTEFLALQGSGIFVRVVDKVDETDPVKAIETNSVSKSSLCVKCQANPMRRNCECLGAMPVRPSKKPKPEPIIRKGWDNVCIREKYGTSYLHVQSDTLVIHKNSRWEWESDYDAKTGKRTYFFANKKTNDVVELMQRVEDYLKENSWTR
jgi:hypothetical protein